MLKVLHNQHLSGRRGGQLAVCSAHPQVLSAAAARAGSDDELLLVETTTNQVNLSGGYTGMTPADFADHLTRLAADRGLAQERVVLGADHLGPHLWYQLPAKEAMTLAEILTRAFVSAGYRKLHLDTGRGCADDPRGRLPVETAAQRAADLCRAAESAAGHFRKQPPWYVIATDYQTPSALKQMVRDHFCLLKIGPCLTFALREALFALAHIENELPGLSHRSSLMAVMEQLMQTHPGHGYARDHGTGPERRYLRRYGLRDRIRYYWSRTEARRACEQLMHNLHQPIPHPLQRQFLPDLAGAIAGGSLPPTPEAILQARIRSALHPYAEVCRHHAVTT